MSPSRLSFSPPSPGVNTYLFAQRYEAAPRLATTVVFLSHVFSVAMLTALLYLFGEVGW